jgi:hypothetical protein
MVVFCRFSSLLEGAFTPTAPESKELKGKLSLAPLWTLSRLLETELTALFCTRV